MQLKKKVRILVCLIVGLFTQVSILNARTEIKARTITDPLVLNNDIKVYETSVVKDPEQMYVEILSNTMQPLNAPFSVGFTTKYVWLYFELKNATDTLLELILSLENPHIDSLYLYEIQAVDSKSVLIGQGGDKMSFHERSYFHRNFIFPVQLEKDEVKRFLLKVDKRNASLSYPLRVWNRNTFVARDELIKVSHGIFVGIFLFITFISLLLGRLTQLSIFRVYGLYVLIICIYVVADWGYFFQFLFPDSYQVNNYIRVVFTYFFNFMMVIFSIVYLSMKQVKPVFAKLLYGVLIAEFTGIWLFFLFRFHIPTYGIVILNFSYCMLFAKYVIVFVFLAITFRQQWFVNLSYFLSVGFVIVASIIIVLIEFGVVRKWFIFFQLLSVGSFIEIILFTVLIIYRIRSVYLHRIELMHQLSEQKKRLIRAFVNGGDRERNFISQELHDNVGTKLVLLKNKLVSNYSTEFVPFVDSVIFDVRQLSHRISPSTLPLIGFKESLQGLIDECCTSSDITISLQFYNLPELSNDQSIPLFRIFQEALKNIVQHSNAHTVEIQLLGYSDQLVVTIDDDGKGIGTDSLKKAKGLGVSNMRSRVDSLGGTFELSSITGQGTSILISIPLTEKK